MFIASGKHRFESDLGRRLFRKHTSNTRSRAYARHLSLNGILQQQGSYGGGQDLRAGLEVVWRRPSIRLPVSRVPDSVER
ncbi:hypothetical protein BC936DRAFT_142991 [Jimgerdemannia flammicorona]|uniref:Uncharacterized protein n=1 Tax=Jimgerdemannia flammicorona TaxID=994334 RepID=A0A432ZZT1_9FUNG|nr:hypothetical protein BC936DRAFT_142991 [Jimgerdemannia flammicorona]